MFMKFFRSFQHDAMHMCLCYAKFTCSVHDGRYMLNTYEWHSIETSDFLCPSHNVSVTPKLSYFT